MTAHVTSIITQLKVVIAATLGASYHELPFVYDVDGKNNERVATLAYGVRPLDALPASGVTRVYTLDHRFEIILTDAICRGGSDAELTTTIGVMYDKADELFKALVHTKVNLASLILDVSQPTLLAPEVYEKKKFIALRMQVSIKYRSALT